MGKEILNLVIAGHLNHGKSTLIGRLLFDTDSLPEGVIKEIKKICDILGKPLEFAFVMDRFKEERERGITIDTTQTFFKTDKRDYVIIDAPGHREFLKNMITGASQAEAAILIVDAKEGVREETKRHAYILKMLGIKQVIVVINKMDLINYAKERFDEIKRELLKFLYSIGIIPPYIIPISAIEGSNVAKKSESMSWYNGPTILEALDIFKPKKNSASKPLRFPIQDVYEINGKKILVGRVESGEIKEGDEVIILPMKKKAIVKTIEVFQKFKKKAQAGESIGVTLEKSPVFIERGQIISGISHLPIITNEIKANIFWTSKESCSKGERFFLRCATQEIRCVLKKINKRIDSSTLEVLEEDADNLRENEIGEVIIATEKPVVIENFNYLPELGRFVLIKKYDISGGGTISLE